MRQFFRQWREEDGSKVPIRYTWWGDILDWLDQIEWLWGKGILKYGNFFYRWTFGPGRCAALFSHLEDYHELCERVYNLEKEVEELKEVMEKKQYKAEWE